MIKMKKNRKWSICGSKKQKENEFVSRKRKKNNTLLQQNSQRFGKKL